MGRWSRGVAVLLAVVGSVGVPLRAAEPSAVVAVVGGQTITVERFEREMARRGGGRPGQFATLEQKQRLLDEMIEFEALAAGAIAEGFDRTPEARALFMRLLVDLYKRERLSPALEQLEVDEAEIERHYREHANDYTRPPRIQVALIFFALDADASDERRAKIEARIEQAREEIAALDPKLRHFGNVARQHSDDRASRYKGGVIGWIDAEAADRYKWGAEVIAAAAALESPGDIAPLVSTDAGRYLVRLVDRDDGQTLPLSTVRDGLRNQLLQQKRQQAMRQQLDELKAGITVQIDDTVLESIDVPTSADTTDQRTPPPLPGR